MILFWILGSVRVASKVGDPVRFAAPPKVRALLAALVLVPNTWVAKDRLAEYLWRSPGPSWEPNLRTYGSQLRRALEASSAGLETRLDSARDLGFRLQTDQSEVDSGRFFRLVERGNDLLRAGDYADAAEHLREGLALWHHPVGADLPDTGPFQEHLDALDRRHRHARADFCEASLSTECASKIITDLHELIATDPLAERPVRLLMEAQLQIGTPASALATYHDFRKRLADHTGTDPSRKLEEFYRRLLRGNDQGEYTPTTRG